MTRCVVCGRNEAIGQVNPNGMATDSRCHDCAAEQDEGRYVEPSEDSDGWIDRSRAEAGLE